MIRQFQESDFNEVCKLLESNHVEPPKRLSDLKGVCFVADVGRIVGVIWALVGESTLAYADYLAVDPEYQANHVGFLLMTKLEMELKLRGVKQWLFHVEKWNIKFLKILDNREGLERLRDLHYFRRTIP